MSARLIHGTRSKRYECNIPVAVVVEGWGEVSAISVDISTNGMRLVSKEEIVVGQCVMVRFTPHPLLGVVAMRAVVRWVQNRLVGLFFVDGAMEIPESYLALLGRRELLVA